MWGQSAGRVSTAQTAASHGSEWPCIIVPSRVLQQVSTAPSSAVRLSPAFLLVTALLWGAPGHAWDTRRAPPASALALPLSQLASPQKLSPGNPGHRWKQGEDLCCLQACCLPSSLLLSLGSHLLSEPPPPAQLHREQEELLPPGAGGAAALPGPPAAGALHLRSAVVRLPGQRACTEAERAFLGRGAARQGLMATGSAGAGDVVLSSKGEHLKGHCCSMPTLHSLGEGGKGKGPHVPPSHPTAPTALPFSLGSLGERPQREGSCADPGVHAEEL